MDPQDDDTVGTLPLTPGLDGVPNRATHKETVDHRNVAEKLEKLGIKSVLWVGKCEADKVAMGRYDVSEGEEGMYGLVFDNTFSKQTSKSVMFVVMTHPTNAPPKSGHHLHYAQAFGSVSLPNTEHGSNPSFSLRAQSSESLPRSSAHRYPKTRRRGPEVTGLEGTTFYTGVLLKKRRKKGQGYAKRFFSLDFTSGTLSYYRDRHSSALRGAVPLSLTAIGANEKTRAFSVDSGAEVWHLRALNMKDFEAWHDALERASAATSGLSASPIPDLGKPSKGSVRAASSPANDREWAQVEQLVSKVAGSRDAMRALARDTDPKYFTGGGFHEVGQGAHQSCDSSKVPSPSFYESTHSYFGEPEDHDRGKRPFWKRKPSGEGSSTGFFRRSSAQLAVPPPSTTGPRHGSIPSGGFAGLSQRPSIASIQTLPHSPGPNHDSTHERCMALLHDLDSVVSDFVALIADSKARRLPTPVASARMSMDSIDNQEYFDAEDSARSPTPLLTIGDEEAEEKDHFSAGGSAAPSTASSSTDDEGLPHPLYDLTPQPTRHTLLQRAPRTLNPLPHGPVQRRQTIPPPLLGPPSIIGFLRKNAKKDLSMVTMPVTANEPTSLLQRLAESLEYTPLLDSAASSSLLPAERLMHIATFAVSYFSYNRAKERAVRKPFNPMLGETYELVREDLGFRFVAEKISHHPVRMACQAESATNGGWSFAQAPQPVQKFWGKSVELESMGRVRVALHAVGEEYSWSQAACFLRNVIAGEKYVEPVQSMTVANETNGMYAVVTFKAGGMFSGRSEDVHVALFDPSTSGDTPLALGLEGKWTEGLVRTDTGARVWTVGSLVPESAKGYGLTTFAAALNEITSLEEGRLPPTDSRLRPDQRALERREVDRAEALKARLEERQRARRKVLEVHGKTWEPVFFEKVGDDPDEELWRLKDGPDGYWGRRERRQWKDLVEIFELQP